MPPFLAWLESTGVSVWIRGSPSIVAFPGILSCHTIGMGFAAGINAAVALPILGVASAVPLGEMRRFLTGADTPAGYRFLNSTGAPPWMLRVTPVMMVASAETYPVFTKEEPVTVMEYGTPLSRAMINISLTFHELEKR